MNKNTATHSVHSKHWHYLYERRKRRVRSMGISSKQMAWSQVFSLVGSIVAGVLLESNKEVLIALAGVFVILPGVFDLDGTLGAVLSAKINHRLEKLGESTVNVLVSSILFAWLIAVLAGLVVAGVGAGIAALFFSANFLNIFQVGFGAILLSAIIGFPIIGALSIFFIKRGMNPDDVVGPIESSIFDILTVITLTIMVRAVL